MASNLRVDTILPSTGTTLGIGTASGTINFLGNSNITTTGTISAASLSVTGSISAASATITGNLGVGGVLTYEDVTNIDSVGVITARSGIRIGATGANQLISGNANAIGFGEADPSPFGGEYRGIDVAYKGSGISGRTGNPTFTMRSNIYYDGSNWKYGEGNTTAGVLSVGGAQLIFESAASGTAGATATITEKLRIDPSGHVTKPNNLCLQYTPSGSIDLSSGTVIYATEVFDVGNSNAYNTSNGEFTAPVTGVYRIHYEHFANNGRATTNIEKDTGSGYSVIKIGMRVYSVASGSNWSSVPTIYYAQLNSGDKIRITHREGTVHLNTPWNHLTIQLVQ